MSITIRPLGGLGNQLFVYAAGFAVARELRTELVADLVELGPSSSRSYALSSFDSSIVRIVDSSKTKNKVISFETIRSRMANVRVARADPLMLRERGFWFDPDILSAPDGSILRGYFQSWKYFHKDPHLLRKEVRSVRNPSDWFLRTKAELESTPPWIGLHVRRGDYANTPRMGLATDYYYTRALELVSQATGITSVVLFSDDLGLAGALPSLARVRELKIVEPPPESSPLENMLLMSLSHHLIMANSSFSWWGAWISDRHGRLVTYPRPWVDFRSVNDRDLPLPNWIGLGRESPEDGVSINVGY